MTKLYSFANAVLILLFFPWINASKPQFAITVQDGTADSFGQFDPSMMWKGESKFGKVNFKFGTEFSIRPTLSLSSLPRNFWGMATREVAGWGILAKAHVSAKDYNNANINVEANSADFDLGLKVALTAGRNSAISKFEAIKGLIIKGARVTINPRYSVPDSEPDVAVTYNNGKTGMKVFASPNSQTLILSQALGGGNVIKPSISSNGAISLDWTLLLDESNTVTTSLKPNDSVNVLWHDGSWKTTINAPLSGFHIHDVTVKIRRNLGF